MLVAEVELVKTRVVKAQVDLEAEALELVLMIQEMQGVLTLVVAEVVDQSLLQAALVDQEL
tara:strand:+ start:531 stop:713 length:183 start_codon:yes stop_codon:yes gene_type:complete